MLYCCDYTLYIQDRDWTEEECSVVTSVLSKAKIRGIEIHRGVSRSNWRTLSDALAYNDHVRTVNLIGVPDELRKEIKRKLHTVKTYVY